MGHQAVKDLGVRLLYPFYLCASQCLSCLSCLLWFWLKVKTFHCWIRLISHHPLTTIAFKTEICPRTRPCYYTRTNTCTTLFLLLLLYFPSSDHLSICVITAHPSRLPETQGQHFQHTHTHWQMDTSHFSIRNSSNTRFGFKLMMKTNGLSPTRWEISFGFAFEGPSCLNTVSLSFISDVTG